MSSNQLNFGYCTKLKNNFESKFLFDILCQMSVRSEIVRKCAMKGSKGVNEMKCCLDEASGFFYVFAHVVVPET